MEASVILRIIIIVVVVIAAVLALAATKPKTVHYENHEYFCKQG